jgi:hypothetical protein
VRIQTPRIRITGEFQALLSDLPIADANENAFAGTSFQSDAFSAWYAPPMYSTDFDFKTRTHAVEISKTKNDEFDLLTIGRVKCTSGVEISSEVRSGVIRSATVFQLDFLSPVSLNEVMATCFSLERLFGFLIGFRGKPPIFNTWLNKTYKVGEHELKYDGKLDIGGINWKEGQPPHPMECIHLNSLGGASLQAILEKFVVNRDDIVTRIHTVEFSRFFSKNINERFSIVMPILESYLKKKYTTPDETTYMEHEKEFFDWIESSKSEAIIEFSRKHIEVKERKTPSLKTLLTRAIDEVNRYGFQFPQQMAGRIQDRRGRLFHSAPQMEEREALELFDEVRAATGLLMLHTYLDLGIDISVLSKRYSALGDLRGFIVPPERPKSEKAP